tara:strand:- start:97 stop:342 length:246 start_codon:yes stop_codon:yes gene_type:complete
MDKIAICAGTLGVLGYYLYKNISNSQCILVESFPQLHQDLKKYLEYYKITDVEKIKLINQKFTELLLTRKSQRQTVNKVIL